MSDSAGWIPGCAGWWPITFAPHSRLPPPASVVTAESLILNIGGCIERRDGSGPPGRARASAGRSDDVFGQFVAETLVVTGSTCALTVDPTRATSQTLIVNVKGEDRRFIHSVGASNGLTPADLDGLLDPAPRVLYVGGYLILKALEPEALAERFQHARRKGVLTMLDVATPGPGDYLRLLRPLLPETDIFLPNADEATLILGETDPVRQALAFRDLGARRVVITQGDRGAVAVSDDLRVRLGTYPVSFVDGSGGGDAFDAGYIAGLLDGLPELDCLKLASAVGASCVRAVGTTAGVFTRPEADAFVRAHELSVEFF